MLVQLTYSCFNVVNVGRYWHKVVLMYRKSLVPLPCPPSWERMAIMPPLPLDPQPWVPLYLVPVTDWYVPLPLGPPPLGKD